MADTLAKADVGDRRRKHRRNKPASHPPHWPANAWYIIGPSAEISQRPRALQRLGQPVVAWRDSSGRPSVLADRCPHRQVPLSLGTVGENGLQCAYHGWTFDHQGRCQRIPSLCRQPPQGRHHQAKDYPCTEVDGMVWAWFGKEEPSEHPSMPWGVDKLQKYHRTDYAVAFDGSLLDTLENILDVPHTAFLHRGLFRQERRHRIRVETVHHGDCVEAHYIGEPRPSGLLGRLLLPKGGEVNHIDRFIMPSIAQVEYQLGSNHLIATTVLSPENRTRVQAFTTVLLRLPFATGMITKALLPFALRVAKQDADMLLSQRDNMRRFPRHRPASTELDVLRPHIARMLRQPSPAAHQPKHLDTLEMEI